MSKNVILLMNNVVQALSDRLSYLLDNKNYITDEIGQSLLVLYDGSVISINANNLEFSNFTTSSDINNAADFARLVNFLPNGSSCYSPDGRMLWQEYENILMQAKVVSDEFTQEEEKQLQNAYNLLEQRYKDYQYYEKAYWQSQAEYNAIKLRAEFSTDSNVQQEWQLNESTYKAKVKATENDWIVKGYKSEIENALATVDQIGGRNPLLLWTKWKDDFKRAERTDMQGYKFYQTYLYPADFWKHEAQEQWITLHLDASELEALKTKSTVFLKENFPSAGQPTEYEEVDFSISHLTIDIIRVSVVRPWLNASIFKSNFWYWPDGRELLSNGENPPEGSLVAYVTAIIFARNPRIEFQSDSEQKANIVEKAKSTEANFLNLFLLENCVLTLDKSQLETEAMQIIAFICQKLPRSPNADATNQLEKGETDLDSSRVDSILSKSLKLMENVNRKIVIAIKNNSKANLTDFKEYLWSGKLNNVSMLIKAGKIGFISASKTDWSVYGTAGVITYWLEGTNKKLAIMWSVPENYLVYENWFKLAIVNADIQTNEELFEDMYYNKCKKTQGEVKKASEGSSNWVQEGYVLNGWMRSDGNATLKIFIEPQ